MKKAVSLLSAATLTAVFAGSALAAKVTPEYTYECAKLTKAVTADGKVDAGEWDDANELVINNDNEVFKKHGQWQGGNVTETSELSVTYKLKWDENNLYILEQRMDKHYIVNDTSAKAPWNNDGTLFFFAVDGGGDITVNDRYNPFWITVGKENKPLVAGRYYKDGNGTETDDTAYTKNWKAGGAKDGDVYTMELIIPWSDIKANTITDFTAAEGANFRFTPIIANMSETGVAAGGAGWSQLNFYDNKDAENPNQWAGLKLVAAIGGGSNNNDTPPATGYDSFGVIAALVIVIASAGLCGTVVLMKKKAR